MTFVTSAFQPSFAVIRAAHRGHPVLIVVDLALDADRWMASFPSLVQVTLPISNPDARGLCDDRESERLADLEDRLLDAADTRSHIYAGRLTGHGVREVLLYAPAPSDLAAALREGARGLSSESQAIEVTCRPDADWSAYRALAGGSPPGP